MIPNPLRDPRDRRLPRVPEPCALVVFGVTGDLARKKLLPAVYDLANRGLLPTGLRAARLRPPRLGRRRLRASSPARRPQEHARTAVARGGLGAAGRQTSRSSPGSFDDDDAFDQLAADARRAARTATASSGNAAFYLSIPPAMFPTVLKQMQRTGMADNDRPAAGAGSSSRSRSATTCQSRRELNALVDNVFTAAGRLPHRPLPGQGDGPEPAGAAVRQHAVRAGLERQLRRLGADHDGRGRRHRRPGRRSTTRPAPPATCCRTTCCSCSR